MKNTTFISAGAGSGKTYRLIQDIARMIIEGKCQAEEIILTTYTEAAAKELREKVRSTLYSKGLYEAAMNIDNAAIGTIHSIAYQFVSRYWYLLGISANVSIMDEEGSKFCISQSLASLPTEEDMNLFYNIFKSFHPTKLVDGITVEDPDFWKKELKDIIDKTVELCIDEEQLVKDSVESKELINKTLKSSEFEITNEIVTDVYKRLKDIFNAIADNARKDKEEKRKELLDSLNDLKNYDGNIANLPLSKLQSLLTDNVKEPAKYLLKNYSDDILYLQDLSEKIPTSRQITGLVISYIDTIFRLAIKWKKEYEEFKRKRCLLDFGDLLQKFHELLEKEEVVADIQSRYKVAFVDEFQDCSPLQVKSFMRLSEVMEQCVWVGDIKQAIYSFRGTNTERIKSIIDSFPNKKGEKDEDGNMLDSLEHCWRSNKTIVDLVNHVFCEKVFNGQLNDNLIRLGIPERNHNTPPAPKERELQHIHIISCNYGKNGVLKPNSRKINNPDALAQKVEELIASGTFKANEIAILYRGNPEVRNCAKALQNRGIAYNARFDRETNGGDSSIDIISSFINAVVSFAARGDNELSKAIIANNIEHGYSTSALLTNRLQYLESKDNDKEWLSDLNIIDRISHLRKTVGNQSVSSAIETLIVELNLADFIKRIDPSAPTYNYISALESKAATYESTCANLGLSSTLFGFVEYLKSHPIEYPGDDNGVSVMTYHKSKGLEWPCVILCSLHVAPVEAKKTFFGVLTYNTETDTLLRLIPASMKSFSSTILDNIEDNEFFRQIKQATINEAKRLIYVGMTRPKEQLILTTYGSKDGDDWLKAIGCDSIDSHAKASVINWGGAIWNHSVVNYVAPDGDDIISDDVVSFNVLKLQDGHRPFSSKFISPSKAKADKQLYDVEQYATIAERISATDADGRDSTIGDFIHHVMCLWNGDKSIIGKLAQTYGVKVDVEAVATSITNFWNWLEMTYGKPFSTERELPFSFTNELGQTVSGEIDLIYRTEKGDVLIDYKTFQGKVTALTDKDSDFFAGKYGLQIEYYEQALKLNNYKVTDRLVCYLSLGVIIRFK